MSQWLRMWYEPVSVARVSVRHEFVYHRDNNGDMCPVVSVKYHRLSKEFIVVFEDAAGRRKSAWLESTGVVYRRLFSPITDGDDDDLRGAATPEVA